MKNKKQYKITAAQQKSFVVTNIILVFILIGMIRFSIITIEERQNTVQIFIPKKQEVTPENKPKTPKGTLKKVALKAQKKRISSTLSSAKKSSQKRRKSTTRRFKSSYDSQFKRKMAALLKNDTIKMVEVNAQKVELKIQDPTTSLSKVLQHKSINNNVSKETAAHSGSADQENKKDNNNYNAIQFYLEGRSLAEDLPNPIYSCDVSGKVVIVIRVNKKGKVIEAFVDPNNTRTTSPCILQNAVKYAKKALFSKSKISVQTGTITYYFTS